MAEAASVSQETVFKYFTTKENLLLEVINPVLLPVFGGFFTHLNEKKL
ncbi:TetR/AcrR family transcriptional regulator [Streptococcus parauberis]|nr:TetR/AcrR family transcriptional regulator [Streptococcus parauberis]MDT2749991.1 TetR/AcrR family transcriptional regulator [Streptococcus parauberis]